MFSILSSHCWRSYSSTTTEHHKALVRVGDEKVNAVPADLKSPQKLHNPRQRQLQPPSLASDKPPAHTHFWRLELLLTSTMGCSKLLVRRATTVPRCAQSVAAQTARIWSVSGRARDGQTGLQKRNTKPLLLMLYKPLRCDRKFYGAISLSTHSELGSKCNCKQL